MKHFLGSYTAFDKNCLAHSSPFFFGDWRLLSSLGCTLQYIINMSSGYCSLTVQCHEYILLIGYCVTEKYFFLNKGSLLASADPWRPFNIHWTKGFFIVEKKLMQKYVQCYWKAYYGVFFKIMYYVMITN